jgi:hypothetical protein
MTAKTVLIEKIVIDTSVSPRRFAYDPDTLDRYQEALDTLPAVDVFDTSEGLLLSDGFHRVEAHRLQERTSIKANVRRGTRDDAVVWGITANVAHGLPLTREERDRAIKELRRVHPEFSLRRIATIVECSTDHVHGVLQAESVRETLVKAKKSAAALPQGVLKEVGKAPRKNWQQLATTAAERNWTAQRTQAVVRSLKDPKVPKHLKETIAAGDADPVEMRDGEFTVAPVVVREALNNAPKGDPWAIIITSIQAFDRWQRLGSDLQKLSKEQMKRLEADLPRMQAFLSDVATELKSHTKLRAVK